MFWPNRALIIAGCKTHTNFFHTSSDSEITTDFVDILAIHNVQISYVKPVLEPLHVFFTLFGCMDRGAGGSQGRWGSTYLCIFPPSQLKNGSFRNRFFFDIVTIPNDQICYVNHVLHHVYVDFTWFGCLDRGKGLGHNLLMQFSTLRSSKMEISENSFSYTHHSQLSNILCKACFRPSLCFFHTVWVSERGWWASE